MRPGSQQIGNKCGNTPCWFWFTTRGVVHVFSPTCFEMLLLVHDEQIVPNNLVGHVAIPKSDHQPVLLLLRPPHGRLLLFSMDARWFDMKLSWTATQLGPSCKYRSWIQTLCHRIQQLSYSEVGMRSSNPIAPSNFGQKRFCEDIHFDVSNNHSYISIHLGLFKVTICYLLLG